MMDALFRPRSIAVIGASSRDGAFQIGGRALLDHLLAHGFNGEVFPISHNAPTIAGVPTYPSFAALPHAPDCAVISVPAAAAAGAMRDALAIGIRAFVVLTSGFAETGEHGVALQRELAEIVHGAGALMLGPNTTGYVNVRDRIALSSTSRLKGALPRLGSVGVVVQSGALGSAVLDLAADRGIGLSALISSGNEASHGLADFIEALVDDEATTAIAVYAEGFNAPSAFVAAAEHAALAGKPLVILKTGSTEAGRKAAAGHTGALAGSHRVQQALFRQLGVVMVESLEALLDTASLLARPLYRRARRPGVLTISGGLGGLVADGLARAGGIALPALGVPAQQALRAHLPPFLAFANPFDNGGIPFREPGGFRRCLADFAADPAFDSVVVALTPIVAAWGPEVVDAVTDVQQHSGKPIFVCFQAGSFCADTIAALRRAETPTFQSVPELAAAYAAAAHWTPPRPRPQARRPDATPVMLPDVAVLDEASVKALLRARGLPTPREAVTAADDPAGLVAAAAAIGFPLVLKALADGIAHKSELGLVSVGLPDEAALLAAADRQRGAVARHGAVLKGFLLAELVRPAAEAIVGVTVDEQFGPVLSFGTGGLFTEIHDDVALRVLPVDAPAVEAMIAETRLARILGGARGQSALDGAAVRDFVLGLASLALDLGERLEGIEVNPLAIFPDGVAALDAKIFLKPAGAP